MSNLQPKPRKRGPRNEHHYPPICTDCDYLRCASYTCRHEGGQRYYWRCWLGVSLPYKKNSCKKFKRIFT